MDPEDELVHLGSGGVTTEDPYNTGQFTKKRWRGPPKNPPREEDVGI